MGPIGSPETSVDSCQYAAYSPEERRTRLHRGRNLKSRMVPNSFREVKRPGREADNSSPSIVEVKNEWSYVSIHLHAFTIRTETTLLLPCNWDRLRSSVGLQ